MIVFIYSLVGFVLNLCLAYFFYQRGEWFCVISLFGAFLAVPIIISKLERRD